MMAEHSGEEGAWGFESGPTPEEHAAVLAKRAEADEFEAPPEGWEFIGWTWPQESFPTMFPYCFLPNDGSGPPLRKGLRPAYAPPHPGSTQGGSGG